MKDFVTRLMARSSGEKSSVRPTIAPAFAPEAPKPRRRPAGEILQNAPEHLPAIAPLPFETLRQKESPDRVQPLPNLQSPKSDPQAPQQPATLPDYPQRIKSREGREGPQLRERNQAILETDVVAPISPLAMRPDVHNREFFEPRKVSQVEMQGSSTIAAARESKPVHNDAPSEPIAPASSLQPPVFAARPSPERNTDPSLQNSRKTKAGESVVQVTIGKIEVRAFITSPKSAEKKTQSGVMSLEEYQRARNRRSAG